MMRESSLSNFLTNADLIETIQEVAHKQGRMANQMAERAVQTLRDLSEGKEVSPRDLDNAKKLLEFVSKGTLLYVERIQARHGWLCS